MKYTPSVCEVYVCSVTLFVKVKILSKQKIFFVLLAMRDKIYLDIRPYMQLTAVNYLKVEFLSVKFNRLFLK